MPVSVEDVINSLAFHIAVVNETGRIIVSNNAWKRFAQENGGSDCVGQNYLAACENSVANCRNEDAVRAARGLQAVLEGAAPSFEMEYPCHSPEEERWFHMRASPLHGAQRGAVIVHEKITERRRVQEALWLFRNLVDQSADFFEVADPETGRFLDVSQRACEELGYTREEFLSLRVCDIDPVITEATWPEAADQVRKSGLVHRRDLYRRRKDGSTFPIEINGRWVRLDRDYIVTVVRNITERVQAEEQVREQAAMLNFAHDPIIVRRFHDDIITFWSKGAENLYGWSAAEALGCDIGELICVDPKTPDIIREALRKSKEWQGENLNRTKDGRQRVINTRATLVSDAAGEPKSVMSINIDVTEQKEHEAKSLRAQRMQSIGVLASGVSHDLGNVLLPIVVCAPFLRKQLPAEKREEIVSTIETSAERGMQIVRQILTFGRGVEGERQPVEVCALIQESLKIIRGTFPKNIQIESVLGPRLRPVVGDATQLLQVLLNLCLNARDAMPDGGRLTLRASEIDVDVGYASMQLDAPPGHYVMFEVRDTGTGIASEVAERMFEPFFTTKGLGQGTGLGLSTVLGIVKSHDGFIDVKTELRPGTAFQVYLPVSPDLSPELTPASPEAPPKGHGEVILVVDDEPAVRTAARLALESAGYQVLLAADGAEAVGTFATKRDSIALVVTDLNMPYLDGLGLIRALRKLAPKLPIVVSTGVGEKLPRSELKAMNVDHILNKPFGGCTLFRVLAEALHPKGS